MVIQQGGIWWADLPAPQGSEPGYRRPVLIAQSNSFNFSRINTVVCVTITSNLRLKNAPGNFFQPSADSGLDRDSAANVSQVITLDKQFLTERVNMLSDQLFETVLDGSGLFLGR